MQQSTQTAVLAESAGHGWKRRPLEPDEERVLGPTWSWLAALPEGARPVHLPAHFPRIANDLARLWADPAALDRYFDETEHDVRPGLRGFTPLVKEELLALHLHALRQRLLARGRRTLQQPSPSR